MGDRIDLGLLLNLDVGSLTVNKKKRRAKKRRATVSTESVLLRAAAIKFYLNAANTVGLSGFLFARPVHTAT